MLQNNKLHDNVYNYDGILVSGLLDRMQLFFSSFCVNLQSCISVQKLLRLCIVIMVTTAVARHCHYDYAAHYAWYITWTELRMPLNSVNLYMFQKSITYMKCGHSCTILLHGIVLQEQWIWSIHDVLFHRLTRKVSKGSSAVWETYPACERTICHARTKAFTVFAPQDGLPSSSLRLLLALGNSFVRQACLYPAQHDSALVTVLIEVCSSMY